MNCYSGILNQEKDISIEILAMSDGKRILVH
jgi:hypothetical protein